MKIRLPQFLFILLFIILISRILYPYTRFAHKESISHVGTVRLNREELKLCPGETFSLHLIGTINRRCSYESSDFKVAFISPTGKITARKSGIAIIRVTQDEQIYTCRVKVLESDE